MAFNATTGVGTPAQIAVDSANVTLSLSGTTTHQITATIEDVNGNPVGQLTLSAVAAASGGTTAYTGTITGGGSNALAGFTFVVAGFTNGVNNGTFVATASTTTTLTLANPAGVVETHAGTATPQGFNPATTITYDNSGEQGLVGGTPTQVATVSGSGLITATTQGQTTIEVAYPFANAGGTPISAGGANWPPNKIYKLITVQVNH